MALTLNSKSFSVAGDRAQVIADFTFDSSYAYGGEAMDPDQILGLHTVETALFETSGGYNVQYDRTNKKIKVFGPPTAPPIVFEEQCTPTAAGVITLKYPPAYIMAISNLSQPIRMTTTGATLIAGQAKPTAVFSEGNLSSISVYPAYNEITNGDFGTACDGWTLGADWADATNAAHKAATGDTHMNHAAFAATAGHTYRCIYTLTWTAGTFTINIGGAAGTARGSTATFTEDITATTTGGIEFTTSGAASHGTIDNVYIYDMTGTVYVTYVTQAWKDVWDNLVQEETQATVAHAATLTNFPLAIQCIKAVGSTSYNACVMECHDDTVAQGSCVIVPATGVLTFHATDAITSCVVTYVKKPTSGFLYDRFIANEDFTAASNVCTPTYPILLWGYSGQLPEKTATTEEFIALGGTAGTGEAKLDLITAGTKITGQSITTGVGVYVWGRPNEIVTTPLEVASGTDLSGLTVRGMFIGT